MVYNKKVVQLKYDSIITKDFFNLGSKIPYSNSYFSRLSIDLKTGESTYSDPEKPRFSSKFSLEGKEYSEVHHNYGSKDNIPFELHYNQKFGIIAFTQWPESTFWVLDRIE